MLTLYVKTGCPFCAKVLAAGEELGLSFDLKNVADPGVAEELVEKGGKKQEPYLIDTDTGIAMYEAGLIVSYLRAHYGNESGTPSGAADANDTDANGDVCPV
jgi:glutathione S-transferase